MTVLTPTALICMGFVFVIWLINELFVEFRNQTHSKEISHEAKRNNNYLMGGTLFCMMAFGIFLSVNLAGTSIGFLPFTFLSYLGSFVAFVGVVIRRISINTLKSGFDGLIQIKEKQELNTEGLYQVVRHPSYTGSILFFFGFGLSSQNIFTLMILTGFISWVYHFRIRYEEDMLVKAFGTEYLHYKENTKPFFPSYKTIKQLGVKLFVQRSKNNI